MTQGIKADIGEIEIEVCGQIIKLPVRTELMLQHLMGELSEAEFMKTVVEEAPQWIEVKTV